MRDYEDVFMRFPTVCQLRCVVALISSEYHIKANPCANFAKNRLLFE